MAVCIAPIADHRVRRGVSRVRRARRKRITLGETLIAWLRYHNAI